MVQNECNPLRFKLIFYSSERSKIYSGWNGTVHINIIFAFTNPDSSWNRLNAVRKYFFVALCFDMTSDFPKSVSIFQFQCEKIVLPSRSLAPLHTLAVLGDINVLVWHKINVVHKSITHFESLMCKNPAISTACHMSRPKLNLTRKYARQTFDVPCFICWRQWWSKSVHCLTAPNNFATGT